jgi:hypothetical protein
VWLCRVGALWVGIAASGWLYAERFAEPCYCELERREEDLAFAGFGAGCPEVFAREVGEAFAEDDPAGFAFCEAGRVDEEADGGVR